MKTAFCAVATRGEAAIARTRTNTRGLIEAERKGFITYKAWTDSGRPRFTAKFARPWCLLLVLAALAAPAFAGTEQDAMSRDLLEVTIPQLEMMYREHKYTVTQVVQWYLARITKYNGIYRAVQNVAAAGALATAAREDAEASPHGPLWGVPIVTKANTSVKGLVTSDGWQGYMIPGHELIAPKDAVIVAKLRAAGAIILGQTNMPDFAASDTNRSTALAAPATPTMSALVREALPAAR